MLNVAPINVSNDSSKFKLLVKQSFQNILEEYGGKIVLPNIKIYLEVVIIRIVLPMGRQIVQWSKIESPASYHLYMPI